MKAPRFWPSATLILLPVVILAGLAGYGLVQHRAAAEAQAVRHCRIELVKETWSQVLDAAVESKPDTILFEDPPIPQNPNAQSLALDAALDAKDEAALRKLADENQVYPGSMTASGLPVATMAAWHLARLSKAEQDIQFAADLSIHKSPSILSESILKELPALAEKPLGAAFWSVAWKDAETARHALQVASPVWMPDRNEPEQLVVVSTHVSRLVGHVITGKNVSTDISEMPELALVSPRTAGHSRVLLEFDLKTCVKTAQAKLKGILPDWAVITATAKQHWLGRNDLHVLASAEARGFQLSVGPANAALIFQEHRTLVWWATALIGSMGLIALVGLHRLHRTLERERKLNEMKSQFVSSVSHELRAPIGSVRLMADALASGKVTGVPAAEFHRLIASEGSRLSALIENVLDFARIEGGRKRYHFAETDLHALIKDAVNLMTPQAEARKQSIRMDLQPLPSDPKLDAAAMQQVVINLLDNALKFSPPETEIVITLNPHASEPTCVLSVSDHGRGIPENEHERIFERFYRLGNELQRETTGTGIGLAIVKHVVEAHSGKIEVQSPSTETGGTTMILTLPIVEDDVRRPALEKPPSTTQSSKNSP